MQEKLLTFCLLVCFAVLTKAQEPIVSSNLNAPKFKFETEMIDYGIIEYASDGERHFKFKNVGKEPLIITTANSSCGCLVASWPKEPIMPDSSGVIKAHYHTKRVGAFQKTISVSSNADRPSIVLTIKGVVKPEQVVVPVNSEIQDRQK